MSDTVIRFAAARPIALARKAKRDPFLGLHPRRKAITIDPEPDGTFGVRLWPRDTAGAEAFFHKYATATEARSRAHAAVHRHPEVYQFVVDRSEMPAAGDDV
ncbi:MAG TPA: hypothetical protein VF649_13800 [Sphingomonas sp.]|jgi:hypothetical protein|uniref:hypothetical protein n=1 Tax=Sphingomonas sp. TaxID=28214 RepID=UPI002ED935C9